MAIFYTMSLRPTETQQSAIQELGNESKFSGCQAKSESNLLCQ